MRHPQIGQVPARPLVDLCDAVREVANDLLRVDGDHPDVAWARERLAEVSARLRSIGSASDAPRAFGGAEGETRPYYFPGAREPRVHVAAPWMTGEHEGDRRWGKVRFELIHEGPPGCVHGGHLAWMFDQAFGQHVVQSEIGGPTHRLEVTYRRPTPMGRELDYEVCTDRVEGRKIFANAWLRDGETLLAEASALFVEPRQGFLQGR